jgi:hypothetical protein
LTKGCNFTIVWRERESTRTRERKTEKERERERGKENIECGSWN